MGLSDEQRESLYEKRLEILNKLAKIEKDSDDSSSSSEETRWYHESSTSVEVKPQNPSLLQYSNIKVKPKYQVNIYIYLSIIYLFLKNIF